MAALFAVMMAAPMDGGADCNYDVSADGMAALIAIIIAALIVDSRRGHDGSTDPNYDGNASAAALIKIMMAALMDGGVFCSLDSDFGR